MIVYLIGCMPQQVTIDDRKRDSCYRQPSIVTNTPFATPTVVSVTKTLSSPETFVSITASQRSATRPWCLHRLRYDSTRRAQTPNHRFARRRNGLYHRQWAGSESLMPVM